MPDELSLKPNGIYATKIVLQKEIVIPDSIYAPMIMFQTGINMGKLHTTCQITLAAAKITEPGTERETWESTGQTQMIYLSDLVNLDPDLSMVGEQAALLYRGMLELIAAINETRKVL
jgi:hypothetical protein